MSPEQRQHEEATSAVVRAVKAAQSSDRMAVAFDIVCAAMLICGEDQLLRSALAMFMLKQAKQLDGDAVGATQQ
jgi:hypothetical protein